jgi:hypothetical protein
VILRPVPKPARSVLRSRFCFVKYTYYHDLQLHWATTAMTVRVLLPLPRPTVFYEGLRQYRRVHDKSGTDVPRRNALLHQRRDRTAAKRNRWLYGDVSILKTSWSEHKCSRGCWRLCVEGALDVAAQRVPGHNFSSDNLRSMYKSSSSRALQCFGVSITCRPTS